MSLLNKIVFVLLTLVSVIQLRAEVAPPLETVKAVDLQRYLGRWYEIASLPQWFQRNCFGTTAEYSLQDNHIRVVNRCFKNSLRGPESVARGKAWAVDASNAKLKVQFFWPFRGDYWIIELGDNYEYAVVGNPDRKYLWILSRTPQMDQSLYDELLEKIKNKHSYSNLDKLQKTIH